MGRPGRYREGSWRALRDAGRFGFEYIDSAARLKQPLLRKGNQLVEVPWLEAMHTIVDRFADIRKKHGPEAIAGLITARCTNEELYLFQKLMRSGIPEPTISTAAPAMVT